jgi:hypothetical protein
MKRHGCQQPPYQPPRLQKRPSAFGRREFEAYVRRDRPVDPEFVEMRTFHVRGRSIRVAVNYYCADHACPFCAGVRTLVEYAEAGTSASRALEERAVYAISLLLRSRTPPLRARERWLTLQCA